MDVRTLAILEFDQIREQLKEYTVSGLGKRLVDRLKPYTQMGAVENALRETTEAAELLGGGARVPLHGLADVSELVERVESGGVLAAGELLKLGDLLRGCGEMSRYMQGKRQVAPSLSAYAAGIVPLDELEEIIAASIEGSRVSSTASPRLARLRSAMRAAEGKIQEKLQSIVASSRYRDILQEAYVSVRDGRYVVPVKASDKHRLDGAVIGVSGSGSTVFMEPAAVRRLADELAVLRAEEEAEEYQVLAALTGEVALHLAEIRRDIEIMAAYDFALAKGKYSRALRGTPACMNNAGRIRIRQGRHPFLKGEPVPLDLEIGDDYRVLIITGPNTGGKTVAMKTLGLLSLMAQAGLHVPADTGTELAVFDQILADIGDGQSIQQSLSTFSSHISNIVSILGQVGPNSLVLLDEIGTGTDPAEGSALAAAVLDELGERGSVAAVSTHYSDIKRYAANHPGFRNGCMEFDRETLQPLYRLKVGEAGNSNALWIAARLGIPEALLERARSYLRQPPEALDVYSSGSSMRPTVPLPAKTTPPPQEATPNKPVFAVGDAVYVSPLGEKGIIAAPEDLRGMYTVLVKGERRQVNWKRLSLLVAKEHLYPENYDMDIVLLSKADRKLRHDMQRKYVEGVRVVKEEEIEREQ